VKNNSTSLSNRHYLYESIVPSEYVSLQTILYEVRQKQGEIRNLDIRDKKKLGVNSPAWMLQQIWKYPETAMIKLRSWAEEKINKVERTHCQNKRDGRRGCALVPKTNSRETAAIYTNYWEV
jgi:hypothetical protein